jgi:hypothetical protein
VVLGRRVCEVGPFGPACSRGKRKGLLAWVRAEIEERERERGRGKGFCLFFNFLSNSFFKHSNSNQTKSMHSNHDAQPLIISKLF